MRSEEELDAKEADEQPIYDPDKVECVVCDKQLNNWEINGCLNCGEPVCRDCSEGMDDLYYGWCAYCLTP